MHFRTSSTYISRSTFCALFTIQSSTAVFPLLDHKQKPRFRREAGTVLRFGRYDLLANGVVFARASCFYQSLPVRFLIFGGLDFEAEQLPSITCSRSRIWSFKPYRPVSKIFWRSHEIVVSSYYEVLIL